MLVTPAVVEHLELFSDPDMTSAVVAVGLLFLPVTINQVRQGILRGLGCPLGAQFPELVLQPTFFTALIGLAMLVSWRLDAVRAIELMLLSSAIGVGSGFWLLVPALKRNLRWPPVFFPVSWLTRAGSTFYHFAASTVMSATDLLMLGHLSDAEETGIYGVATRFHLLMMLPSLATSSTLSHEVSRLYALGKRGALEATARRSATYAAFMSIAVALVCTMITFHLGAIFGAEFEAAALPILILVWARSVEVLLGQPGVILANTTFVGISGAVVTIAAGLNVILNALLIPHFGSTGAATATATSHLVLASILTVLTLRKSKVVSLPFFRLPSLEKPPHGNQS
jgi:O-antigen/teichoic acid export membrane protein